jgi:hypothetical protein
MNPGIRQQLHFKIQRISEEVNRKASGLDFIKQATRMSNRLQKMRKWTLWRGWPPLKLQKRLHME